MPTGATQATDGAAEDEPRTVYDWIARESDRWARFAVREDRPGGAEGARLRDAGWATYGSTRISHLWCVAETARDMRLLARWSRALSVADLACDPQPCAEDAAAVLDRRAEEFKVLGYALQSHARAEGMPLPPSSFLATRLWLAAASAAWLFRRFDPTSALLSIDDLFPAPTPPTAPSR